MIKNILIYGAGIGGKECYKNIIKRPEFNVIAFIDDNEKLIGKSIYKVRIINKREISKYIYNYNIEQIILALPSINQNIRNKLISNLIKYPVKILTLPSLSSLLNNERKIDDTQDLEINDLILRKEIKVNYNNINQKNITNKIIMITGAGGSIGSELTRQIVKNKPKLVILLEMNENSLYQIDQEITKFIKINKLKIKIINILDNLDDTKKIEIILKKFKPTTIYHAAAYKHVPMIEKNLIRGIENNIFGTFNLIKASIKYKVENLLLISTDKAVNPSNHMGISKRICELIIVALSNLKKIKIDDENISLNTKFTYVRFGNVVDSSGSVIPLFRKQINEGGPLTITHKKMKRYLMTIPEAVQLVLIASSIGKKFHKNNYFLNMGDQVNIYELAKRMIMLSGKSLKPNIFQKEYIKIIVSGIRPGEKLSEELYSNKDIIKKTRYKNIYQVFDEDIEWDELNKYLIKLKEYINKNNLLKSKEIIEKIINNY